MAVRQTTVRVPEELIEAAQKAGPTFNDVVIVALEKYLGQERRKRALQEARELREELQRRNVPSGNSAEIVRDLRERGRELD